MRRMEGKVKAERRWQRLAYWGNSEEPKFYSR